MEVVFPVFWFAVMILNSFIAKSALNHAILGLATLVQDQAEKTLDVRLKIGKKVH
jgi:hypothetical protein